MTTILARRLIPVVPLALLLVAALALAGCRLDPTASPGEATVSTARASLAADDPPQFSDWSAPVNLGPMVS